MTSVTPSDVDTAAAFAHRLRGHPDRINPPGWRVDLRAAPAPFKVYEPAAGDDPPDDLRELFVSLTGVTRARMAALDGRPRHRRPVASGGGLYPVELYLVRTGAGGRRPGVAHFDAARHRFTPLGLAEPAGRLRHALAAEPGTPLAPAAVVLTHRFAKNAFKYGNFAYRLGAVDLGLVLGRLTRRLGDAGTPFEVRVDLPPGADDLIGADGCDEAVYAVVTLGRPAAVPPSSPRPAATRAHERATTSVRLPELARMHAAAERSWPVPAAPPVAAPRWSGAAECRPLPPAPPLGPGRVGRLTARASRGRYLSGRPAAGADLALVLSDAVAQLTSLTRHSPGPPAPSPLLCCAVVAVHGIPPGCYGYDPVAHALVPVGGPVDVQSLLRNPVFDAGRSAFVIGVAAALEFGDAARGPRDYRIQQMWVGAAVDAVTVAATACGLTAHPLLGFDAERADRHFRPPPGTGLLAIVCAGRTRPAPVLEGSVW